MTKALIVREDIHIKAPAEIVWKHLTTAESTRIYMYGIGIQSTWKVGEPVNWFGPNKEGKEELILTGTLLAYDPYNSYQYDIFWIASDREDIPDNYTTVTMVFEPTTEGTHLKIEQGDFSTLSGGEAAFKETPGMWRSALQQVKELAEAEAE